MEYINAIIHALDAAKIRADYYRQSKNLRYLNECQEWLMVAKIYSEAELNYNGGCVSDEPTFLKEAA